MSLPSVIVLAIQVGDSDDCSPRLHYLFACEYRKVADALDDIVGHSVALVFARKVGLVGDT